MRRVPRRVVGAMINLVRAQWFRLMRNRAFWGLLAVFAGVVLVASLQVTERGRPIATFRCSHSTAPRRWSR